VLLEEIYMRVLHRVVLALGSLGFVALAVQPARAAQGGDIVGGYSYVYDSDASTAYPAGWFVSASANMNDMFAFVADIGGNYKSESVTAGGVTSTASLNTHTFMVGPRVMARSGAIGFYGQFLIGAARMSGGASTTVLGSPISVSVSDTEVCYAPGAGIDFGLGARTAARVGISEHLIHGSGYTEKQFQLQFGLSYRFGLGR
jgi:Outer membrane protein beta-barrel domain